MRSSIAAQSIDSVPPAPGWTVRMQLRSSSSPLIMRSISQATISLFSRSYSSSSSELSFSSSRSSDNSSASLISASSLAYFSTGSLMRAILRFSSRALSGLFQIAESEACSFSWRSSLRFSSRSKRPPEQFQPLLQV